MDAEPTARQIIEAVRARRAEIILTPAGQLVSWVAGLAPGLTSEVLHLVQQLTLPTPAGQPARGTGGGIPGHALNPALARKAFDCLTALGRAAAGRFNKRPQPLPGSGSRPASGQELMTCSAARTRSSSSRSAWRRARDMSSSRCPGSSRSSVSASALRVRQPAALPSTPSRSSSSSSRSLRGDRESSRPLNFTRPAFSPTQAAQTL